MSTNSYLRRFVKDGLVGVVIAVVIGFGFLTAILIATWIAYRNFRDIVEVFFLFIILVTFVSVVVFLSIGVSGRYLEDISSRFGWLKPILIISLASWLLDVIPLTMFGGLELEFVKATGIIASAGFLIGFLTGVILNPTKRLQRIIIGVVTSFIIEFGVGIALIGFGQQ